MNKTIKLKLEGLVLCYMLLTRLEELGRTGHIVHKDKQIINRTIKHLKRKETLIDMLDDEIPEDLDIIIAEFEHLLSRSEEHTSELQSRGHLVCRLLLEKTNTNT